MVQLFRLCGLGLLRFDFFGSCFNELFNFLFAVFPYFFLFLQVFLNLIQQGVHVCWRYYVAWIPASAASFLSASRLRAEDRHGSQPILGLRL